MASLSVLGRMKPDSNAPAQSAPDQKPEMSEVEKDVRALLGRDGRLSEEDKRVVVGRVEDKLVEFIHMADSHYIKSGAWKRVTRRWQSVPAEFKLNDIVCEAANARVQEIEDLRGYMDICSAVTKMDTDAAAKVLNAHLADMAALDKQTGTYWYNRDHTPSPPEPSVDFKDAAQISGHHPALVPYVDVEEVVEAISAIPKARLDTEVSPAILGRWILEDVRGATNSQRIADAAGIKLKE